MLQDDALVWEVIEQETSAMRQLMSYCELHGLPLDSVPVWALVAEGGRVQAYLMPLYEGDLRSCMHR